MPAINTPIYLLAKYLNPNLYSLNTNEFFMKNHFEFAEEVVSYNHNFYMASHHVQSLFTKIRFEEIIKNSLKDLFSNTLNAGKLTRKDLLDLLKLATTQLFFIFDNKLYNT